MLTNENLLEVFEAAGAADGIVYLSVPITSGLREVQLLTELGIESSELRSRFRDRWRQEVVAPNEADALECARRVRLAVSDLLVIDPTRLSVTGWEQDDYNGFWVRLMERHAVRLIAAPGWEFSRGARGEVGFAVALGIAVTDLAGTVLVLSDLGAIDAAAREKLAAEGWSGERIGAYLPVLDYDARPQMTPGPASQAFDWLVRERAYQVRKFGTHQDDEHTRAGLGEDGWWWRQLLNYYGRASVLTLDTVVGRQALAKFTATACGLLESVVRVHGTLPRPGVPSGSVENNGNDA